VARAAGALRRCDRDPIEGLTRIGLDELSYRRHHEYITVVVDHVGGHVVWAKPGKNTDTLKAFFAREPPPITGQPRTRLF
jgi:transposase